MFPANFAFDKEASTASAIEKMSSTMSNLTHVPLSVSSGLKQPSVLRGRTEDETPTNELPDRPSSNQLQQQQPPSLHHRPASSRFLNRWLYETLLDATTETETTTEPEALSHNNRDERTDPPLSLDKKYLEQLKADILHLHHAHQQLEKEVRDRSAVSATQAPNHVKNLLLNRDTKAYLGWSSQHELELNADSGISQATTAILHTQLLRYNYSSDPAQLAAAKIGLEGLLSDTLISLMEFCLNHDSFDHNGNEKPGVSPDGLGANSNIFRMKLIRPQRHSDASIPFANGCGTSSVSIYVGGILSVLQQTERVMLASTGERKVLIKAITDKDARLGELTEQLSFFKDALARRRPRLERSWKAQIPVEERVLVDTPESTDIEDTSQSKLDAQKEQLARLTTLEKEKVESILLIQNLEGQKDELEQQVRPF
ncbi:unnamed protein product [Phytophthora lilii]|uniref:Unnamed protein product n=1 Tax=Phytophthora lilii TaxID=2077276 RepID=A0A9W6TZ96_9STRA|nr:unnamed protein product [Phytophthora lilii]